MRVILQRNFATKPEDAGLMLGTSILSRLLISTVLVFGIILYATNSVNEQTLSTLIIIMSFSLILKSFEIFDIWFESQSKSIYITIAKVTALTIVALIKIVLIYNEASIEWIATSIVLEFAIAAIITVYFFIKRFSLLASTAFKLSAFKGIIIESWPLIFTTLSMSLYTRIDQIMIKHIIDDASLGIYAVSVKFSVILSLLPLVVSASAFPVLIKSFEANKDAFISKLTKLLCFFIYSAIAIGVVTFYFSDFIIVTIFSDQFSASAEVLRVHVFSVVFVFMITIQSVWDVTHGLIKFSMYRSIAAAILNIILNFVFIPQYGIIGAAWATVISQLFVAVIFNLANKRARSFVFIQIKALNFLPYIK